MATASKNLVSRTTTSEYDSKLPRDLHIPVIRVPVYRLRKQGLNAPNNTYTLDAQGTARPCSTEIRRQNHFVSTDRMLATETFKDTDNDRLPVVELKPFRQKEWRPSKSLPDWERRAFQNLRSAVSTRSLDFESAGYPDPDKQLTITPRIPGGPCPKAFGSQTERKHLHPVLKDTKDLTCENDYSRPRVPERLSEHPEGFISKVEREKSTIGEVRNGSTICTQFSCSKRALTDGDKQNQQVIRVSGTKLDNGPSKGSSLYFSIPEYYMMKRSYTMAASATPSAITKSQTEMVNDMQLHMDGVETTYLDNAIYDAFDRSSTLPSIRVRKAHMKKRKPVPATQSPSHSSGSLRSSARRSHRPVYRLGVTNSLDLMSHIGRPADVEHKLSHDFKLNLHNIRRNKESGPLVAGAYRVNPNQDTPPAWGDAGRRSGNRHHPTRTGYESRQNTLVHRPVQTSRPSTHFKSENVDSGFESTGFRSPVKPMSSVYSPTFHVSAKPVERELTVTANIPSDADEYAVSEAGYGSVDDNPRAAQNSLEELNDNNNYLGSKIVRSEHHTERLENLAAPTPREEADRQNAVPCDDTFVADQGIPLRIDTPASVNRDSGAPPVSTTDQKARGSPSRPNEVDQDKLHVNETRVSTSDISSVDHTEHPGVPGSEEGEDHNKNATTGDSPGPEQTENTISNESHDSEQTPNDTTNDTVDPEQLENNTPSDTRDPEQTQHDTSSDNHDPEQTHNDTSGDTLDAVQTQDDSPNGGIEREKISEQQNSNDISGEIHYRDNNNREIEDDTSELNPVSNEPEDERETSSKFPSPEPDEHALN